MDPGLLNQYEDRGVLAQKPSGEQLRRFMFFMCEMLAYSRHSPARFHLAVVELNPASSPGLNVFNSRGLKIYDQLVRTTPWSCPQISRVKKSIEATPSHGEHLESRHSSYWLDNYLTLRGLLSGASFWLARYKPACCTVKIPGTGQARHSEWSPSESGSFLIIGFNVMA